MRNRTASHAILAAAALAVASGIAPEVVSASSFQLLEQSPSRLGNAFAGTASAAGDATTVFYNPAAMTELEGRQVTAGGNVVLIQAQFDDGGQTTATGPEGDLDETAFIPNLYAVLPLGERLRFGLGINAPFGLATHYDDDWRGRYHATDSELQVVNVNTTLAYAVSDRLSLGAGVSYQTIDATLENAIDSFVACVGGRRGGRRYHAYSRMRGKSGIRAGCAQLQGQPRL